MTEGVADFRSGSRAGPVRCRECDLIQFGPEVDNRATAHCRRCGGHLYRSLENSLDRTVALLIAAMILLVAANTLPFMTFAFKGQAQSNYILSGVLQLWAAGYWPLASLICFASILAPLIYILGMLYVLLPVRLGFTPWGAASLFRVLDGLRPWAMLDVYMFGVFVAVVKLGQIASITPGIGLYSYVGLFVVWTAAIAGLDARVVWGRIGPVEDDDALRAAAAGEAVFCGACEFPNEFAEEVPEAERSCLRCGARMPPRKPQSLSRTWAFLVAAAILYVPANLYPILDITIMGKSEEDTILSGAVVLFEDGMWEIAAIVFLASIMIPTLKLVGLAYLCVSVSRRSNWLPVDRTVLYRWVEVIGRWSMIDMFMVSILVALVQLGGVATILPGLGALCFAAVVVLTMFAAASFDPRLIWDNLEEAQ